MFTMILLTTAMFGLLCYILMIFEYLGTWKPSTRFTFEELFDKFLSDSLLPKPILISDMCYLSCEYNMYTIDIISFHTHGLYELATVILRFLFERGYYQVPFCESGLVELTNGGELSVFFYVTNKTMRRIDDICPCIVPTYSTPHCVVLYQYEWCYESDAFLVYDKNLEPYYEVWLFDE